MPYTTNKGLSVPSTGSLAGTWGSDGTTPTANSSNALNEGVTQLLDQVLGGTTTLSLSSNNVALTQLQTQNGMLRCTGTLTANVAISPDTGVLWTGLYSWENITSGSFSVTVTNSAGSVVLPQTRRGLLWIDTTNGPRIISIVGSSNADPVPNGSKTIFYNNAAPAGWSAVALNDYAIKIVTNGSGGTLSGSVAYATLFGRTATDSYTLTLNDIPSHNHSISGVAISGSGASGGAINGVTTGAAATGSSGGGAAHQHGLDMRVQTAAFSMYERTG